MEVWDWGSPVGTGVFVLMAAVALVLVAVAISVVKNGNLPTVGRRGR